MRILWLVPLALSLGCPSARTQPVQPPAPRAAPREPPAQELAEGTITGLKGWVPAEDRADPVKLEQHVRRGFASGHALCEEEGCKRGLRFRVDGWVEQFPVTWEQIPWTCTLAADIDEKKGATVGSWRLVNGRLEMRERGKEWIVVDLIFAEIEDDPRQKGVKYPTVIYLTYGPWDACWEQVNRVRKEIEDCTPEQEFTEDPGEAEERILKEQPGE